MLSTLKPQPQDKILQLIALFQGDPRPTKIDLGVGVYKDYVIPRNAEGNLGEPTSLIRDAKQSGLLVHVWTFRNEDQFLPKNLAGKPEEEIKRFIAAGVDGLFADSPATAIKARG